MLNKVQKEIMGKALTYRNYEAAKRLDEIEANKRWAEREIPPFPVYKKCENITNNLGWRNLLRGLKP